jgi:hypothetical protein
MLGAILTSQTLKTPLFLALSGSEGDEIGAGFLVGTGSVLVAGALLDITSGRFGTQAFMVRMIKPRTRIFDRLICTEYLEKEDSIN